MAQAAAAEGAGITRQEMIEATAAQLEARAYRVSVRGGQGGRPEPAPVNGQVPDVRGRWVDQVILVAVEDAETLHTEETRRRWRAFGNSYLRFEVACPVALASEARELARRYGVRVHRYWIY